jgi:hypothetical protein
VTGEIDQQFGTMRNKAQGKRAIGAACECRQRSQLDEHADIPACFPLVCDLGPALRLL